MMASNGLLNASGGRSSKRPGALTAAGCQIEEVRLRIWGVGVVLKALAAARRKPVRLNAYEAEFAPAGMAKGRRCGSQEDPVTTCGVQNPDGARGRCIQRLHYPVGNKVGKSARRVMRACEFAPRGGHDHGWPHSGRTIAHLDPCRGKGSDRARRSAGGPCRPRG